MKRFIQATSYLLVLALILPMVSDLMAQAADDYPLTEFADLGSDCGNCIDCSDCDILNFDDLWKGFDNPLKIYINHPLPKPEGDTVFAPFSNTISSTDADTVYNVRVGSKRLVNGTFNSTTEEITGEFLPIFQGLGGRVRRERRIGSIVYELNNVRAFYINEEDPAKQIISIKQVQEMFDLPSSNYSIELGNPKLNKTTGVSTVEVRVRTLVRPLRMERVRAAPAFRDFILGVGSAIQDNLDNRFLMWIIRTVTGISHRPAINRSSIKDLQAFYMGRVVGGVMAAAFSIGEAKAGLALILGSLAAGGFATFMSGGALTIAGATVSIAGVTAGGALVIDGVGAASLALAGAVKDFNGVLFYRNNGNNGKGINMPQNKLRHTYDKHGSDFGMNDNWNKANGEKFRAILHRHIYNAQQVISGTHRGIVRVTHYFCPDTNLNVMIDARGALEGAWELSPAQVFNLLRNGNVQ